MKVIEINRCVECPYYLENRERVIRNSNQYDQHWCNLRGQKKQIALLEKDGNVYMSDLPIPTWCELDNTR